MSTTLTRVFRASVDTKQRYSMSARLLLDALHQRDRFKQDKELLRSVIYQLYDMAKATYATTKDPEWRRARDLCATAIAALELRFK